MAADLLADTINDLLEDNTWNEHDTFSTMAYDIPKPVQFPDDNPYVQAKPMTVDIPVSPCGKSDVYLDDFITVGPDIENCLDRITKAPITVIHTVADNSHVSNSIPRDDIVAIDKMIAEGAAEERKICLGWMIDSRRLRVSLPDRKMIG